MKIDIYSREAIENLLNGHFPPNVAVISFYDPPTKEWRGNAPVNYSEQVNTVFQIALNDIDIDSLGDYGFTVDTYFTEAAELAEFIYAAKDGGFDIICQCEYGQSRSAGCAAAILEHFYKTGISVFADYRYCPSQLVYNKVYYALETYSENVGGEQL